MLVQANLYLRSIIQFCYDNLDDETFNQTQKY
jgi:hypothetical protein